MHSHNLMYQHSINVIKTCVVVVCKGWPGGVWNRKKRHIQPPASWILWLIKHASCWVCQLAWLETTINHPPPQHDTLLSFYYSNKQQQETCNFPWHTLDTLIVIYLCGKFMHNLSSINFLMLAIGVCLSVYLCSNDMLDVYFIVLSFLELRNVPKINWTKRLLFARAP